MELFNSTFWEDGSYAELTSAETHASDVRSPAQGLHERAHVETSLMAFHLTRPEIGKEKLDAVIGPRRIK